MLRRDEVIRIGTHLPCGTYGHVRCYTQANPGLKEIDCYTVVYMDRSPEQEKRGLYECVGLCGHGECILGKHLGKRIHFSELPTQLREIVIADLRSEC